MLSRTSIEQLEARQLLAAIIAVDPADGLRLSTGTPQASFVAGSWDTAGQLDGWSATGATATSTSGSINLIAPTSGTSAVVSRTTIASGPYFDYGYYNYLQLRLQLPTSYNSDLTINFGTSTHTGFSTARQFTIPAAQVAKDGQYHVYRIDLGTQPWWKDTLTDLRITIPTNSALQAEAIDYIEAGDLPNDVLTTYTTDLNMATGVTAATRLSVESKHFVFWYDPAVNPGGNTNWATMSHNALHMSENAYEVYTKLDGYSDPTNYVHDGARHKINIITWYSGYWMGGPYFNVDTSGLQDEGAGNPVPHEFGHVIDGQQGSPLDGGHWESHADFHRSSWSENYSAYFASNAGFEMMTKALEMSCSRQDFPYLIYDDSRIFQAAKEAGIEAQLWQQGTTNSTVYNKIAQVLPSGTNIKDWLGTYMSRWPMLDFSNRSLMRAHYWDTTKNKAYLDWLTGSELIPEPDKGTNWFRVPTERAPEKFAYMFHNLTPSSTSLTVTLNGFNTIDSTQDWRWGLQEIDASNNVRYSPIWAPGTQSWTLNSTANKVILFVIATPSNTNTDLSADYNNHPMQKDMNHLQYPYEVQITGAVPTTGASERLAYPTGTGHLHSNGGGWVDNTASVASTVFVGPNARVIGSAVITGTAKIMDYAVVGDNAVVGGSAIISGYSAVLGNGNVSGNARVRDHALVYWNGVVNSNATVDEHAHIENSTITGNAIAKGNSHPLGGTLSGTAIADYDYAYYYDRSDGVHFGHWAYGAGEYADYDSKITKPRGLIASYRTEESSGDLWWDEYGAEQAILRGSPARPNDAFFNGSQVLQLNGTNQYAILDRQSADTIDATYSMWVNPATTSANQSLLYLGTSALNYFKIIGRNASGNPIVTISVGGSVKTITGSTTIANNSWSHLAVSFGLGVMQLYINGVAAGSIATTFTPSQVLGANDSTVQEGFYVGRDNSGNFFNGKLDDFRVYAATLSAAEITAELNRDNLAAPAIWYKADQTTGSTLTDSSGNAINATLTGTTTFTAGAVNNGLQLNGGYATLPAGVVSTMSSITIAAWINPSSTANWTRIFDFGSDTTHYMFATSRPGSSTLRFAINNGSGEQILNGTSIPTNAWTHIAITMSPAFVTLYVNGVAVASSSAITLRPNDLGATTLNYIGKSQFASDPNYAGKIDDFRVYNTALSADAVTSLYRMTSRTPTIANAAAGSPAGGVITSTNLSVVAREVVSESNLSYTWSLTGTPPAPVTFSVNGTNAAKNTTATFTDPGTYNFLVTITDSLGYFTTSSVTMTVSAGALSYAGTINADNYRVVRNGNNVEIYLNNALNKSVSRALVSSLSFGGSTGNDSLTVDLAGGDPIPSGGMSFDGGLNTDTLTVLGTTGPDNISFSATGVSYGNSPITVSNNETRIFDGKLGLDNLTVTGGVPVQLQTNQSFDALNLAGGQVAVKASGNLVIGAQSIAITAGGKLELHDNDLYIDYGTGASPYSQIYNLVKSGLTMLGGTGSGIASSEVDAQTIPGTMLGVIDNGAIGGQITTLGGLVVPVHSVLIKYTWFGDSNFDGQVNGSDYALLDSGFTSGGSLTGWVFGDFDYGGTVDNSDYALIDTGFIQQNTIL